MMIENCLAVSVDYELYVRAYSDVITRNMLWRLIVLGEIDTFGAKAQSVFTPPKNDLLCSK